MKTGRLLSALALLALAAAAAEPAGPPPVKLVHGRIQGLQAADGMRIYLGIPYARPPVGELRWQEPQPMPNWVEVRPATQFGPRPMQPFIWKDMIFRSATMSEDCLYLNVWVPPGLALTPRPVLLYFNGGGLLGGDGSETRYDGAGLARRGVIVVTANYRLGVFGFLSLPSLTAESKFHASGNYGHLDQVAALRWVRNNIAVFGGDPHHITIGGQSAGSTSVSALMASPLAKDLLAGAIGESGSIVGSAPVLTRAEAEKEGLRFQDKAGVHSLAELRALPANRILELQKGESFARRVVIDGHFLPEAPAEIFFTGRQADIPVLGGWNRADISGPRVLADPNPTPEAFAAAVTKLYGDKAPRLLELYPAQTPAAAAQANNDLSRDRTVAYRTWKWLDTHAKSGGHLVFRYLFAQPQPPEAGEPVDKAPSPFGPPHSAEIAYALGSQDTYTYYRWTPDDRLASEMMQGFFANFIRRADPNGPGLPRWTWMQASLPQVMVITSAPHLEPEPDLQRYEFLDSL